MPAPDTTNAAITELAAAHGLQLAPGGPIRIEEAGLDYLVAFADTTDGKNWVLRMPRREDDFDKIDEELRILKFVEPRLSVTVPDWQVCSNELIAYPLLPGRPGLTLNESGEPDWHFDREDHHYARQLGQLIAELHSIDPDAVDEAGVPLQTANEIREEWQERLDRVTAEFEVNSELLTQWREWIDDDGLWPGYTAFTHGELYPAHLLLDEKNSIKSVLDWTTAKVSDPAVDFMYHHMISTPETFNVAVDAYAEVTGRKPQRLEERCAGLVAAGPLTHADYALTTEDPDLIAASAELLNP